MPQQRGWVDDDVELSWRALFARISLKSLRWEFAAGGYVRHNTQGTQMTRILFVDAEPEVLDALRQTLQPYRHEWTMRFCKGPEQALAVMEEEPYDVVVTDLRMPIMDGVEFLTRVRHLYPDMVRIILSKQCEQ